MHLARCIDSLEGVVGEVVVVDSFSTDRTLEIARSRGARVIQRTWVNHATQFNWALTQLPPDTEWVLRIDADEYLTNRLQSEIKSRLRDVPSGIDGVAFGRRITFQGRMIRHGGVGPVRVLRLFRYGRGQCEKRWMDEHVRVDGPTVDFEGELVDDNRNTLTWWTDKHNHYASREAVDLLNLEYGFIARDSVARLHGGDQAAVKRWVKEVVYSRLPPGLRAGAYFMYRYIIRLGMLDGRAGTAFHVLQGFWYRYLVDAKVAEVRRYMSATGSGPEVAIRAVLGIDVSQAVQRT